MSNKWTVALLFLFGLTYSNVSLSQSCLELFSTELGKSVEFQKEKKSGIISALKRFGYPEGIANRISERYPDLADYLATHPEDALGYVVYRGYKGTWETYDPNYYQTKNKFKPYIKKKHSWDEYKQRRWTYLRRFRDRPYINDPALYIYTSTEIRPAQNWAIGHALFEPVERIKPGYVVELFLPQLIVGHEPGPAFWPTPVLDWHSIPDITPFILRIRPISPSDNHLEPITPNDPGWKSFEEMAPLNPNLK
jgi:hypothetical protein